MTLEMFQNKETTKPRKPKVSIGFNQEQLEISKQEYAERLVNEQLRDEEYAELIKEYQTKHHVSRQDAITGFARNHLEY